MALTRSSERANPIKIMKNLLISGAVLSMLAATPVMASANIAESVRSEIETRKAEIKDAQRKIMEVSAKAEVRQEDRKGDNDEDRGDFREGIAKMRAAVAAKVYTATIVRLEKLVLRIESRIEKIKDAGGATTEAQGFVDAAKLNISDAKLRMTAMMSSDLSTTTASTTLKANFEAVKTEAKAARELLTKAKQNLQKAVNALAGTEKLLKINKGKNATSTPATTSPATN